MVSPHLGEIFAILNRNDGGLSTCTGVKSCVSPYPNLKIKSFWGYRYKWECDLRFRRDHKIKRCKVTINKTERILADVFLGVQRETQNKNLK